MRRRETPLSTGMGMAQPVSRKAAGFKPARLPPPVCDAPGLHPSEVPALVGAEHRVPLSCPSPARRPMSSAQAPGVTSTAWVLPPLPNSVTWPASSRGCRSRCSDQDDAPRKRWRMCPGRHARISPRRQSRPPSGSAAGASLSPMRALLAEIKELIAELPTYGYRRVSRPR